MGLRHSFSLAAGIALALSALSAQAALQPSGTACSFGDLSGAGVTVTDCAGYFIGNDNNNADFGDVKAMLATEFPGVTIGGSIIEQDNVGSGSDFSFDTALGSQAVIGVHWGGGQGGGNTAFYLLSFGAGFDGSFDIVGTNPARGRGGISNVALYATFTPTTPVPEPSTYGLLLAGLGVVGFVTRRRAATQA